MEVVAEMKDSRNIPEQYVETHRAFLPLLESKRKEIESVKRETFRYGSTQRHKLDIYYPDNVQSGTLPPIILFSYGGGMQVGDRNLPDSNGLMYANVGAFFAKRGFLLIVADYRLASAGAVYPDASRDVGDALEWIVANLSKRGDTSRIFLYGHSAGALNQSLLLCHPNLLRTEIRRRIKGAIFNGGAFRFECKVIAVKVQNYFGYDGLHITNSPYGLLRSASEDLVSSLPPILSFRAERDPDFICTIVKDFNDLLKARGVKVSEYTSQGHNHISSNMALCTGQGEDWAEEVIRWIRERL